MEITFFCVCGREIMESRDREFLEWAHVHALKSSLDESKLEQRVKAANEAEAITQQRLATAEAEIAESGQKLGTSRKYRIMLLNIVSLRTVEVGVTSLLGLLKEIDAYC
jgi:E3 ubiquitin-protein ligase BRE1